MKCLGLQYLKPISKLKASGFVPIRDVYLSFSPMKRLVEMMGPRSLRIPRATGEKDVRIKLLYCGLCVWDVQVMSGGPFPMVLGYSSLLSPYIIKILVLNGKNGKTYEITIP
ncbi:hypothetical protein LguiA_016973 [Lonicera macranthoides]